jgi:VIT1/CCC1 family predicted Fe2+/Mn2+ transporter/rubrerythrin
MSEDFVSATWSDHYRDERDAAFMYRALATVEQDAKRRSLFERLAGVEDQHAERWAELFVQHDSPVPSHSPSRRARALVWLARRFGPSSILPLVVAEEGREVEAYLGLARQDRDQPAGKLAISIAADSAEHARELSTAIGREGEPWHVSAATGGVLRSLVYGFNDGLTANFGLVAGVIGASVDHHVIIITGVAGAIADALSMGASGYLAAKSEAEVRSHQIEREREELQLMPDLEEDELALIYETKGLTPEHARETAHAVMRDPEQALKAMVQEELHLGRVDLTPARDGWVTGSATAFGALIPIVPFLVTRGATAIWISLSISMLAHFGVGAARSLFTGRGSWASGRDMFLVGFGVAAIGYVIGELITRIL